MHFDTSRLNLPQETPQEQLNLSGSIQETHL